MDCLPPPCVHTLLLQKSSISVAFSAIGSLLSTLRHIPAQDVLCVYLADVKNQGSSQISPKGQNERKT